ncbi:MAG: D-lactate dehydrogenase [Pseudomonadota bacterium]
MDTGFAHSDVTSAELLDDLRMIIGASHVITNPKSMQRFCKGYRSGEGKALAVVRPGTLLEQWKVLKACVEADKIVIFQASNTGLTEGSTPKETYDRDAVVVSTSRIDDIHLLRDGEQIISLPGGRLFELEKQLRPFGRQPHSVIGSTTIGASIIGGICNNAGGSLIERGVSYTELALYAQVDAMGQLQLVNHLDIDLGNDPETILTRLQNRDYTKADIKTSDRKACDTEYREHIRKVDEPTPSRFNADPRRLYEAAGSAGKLAIFAVRLDTYPKADNEQTFYIGTNSKEALTKLRRDVLGGFENLPVSAEYVHANLYDVAKRYGKDTLVLIDKLGTDRLPALFALKGWLDARLNAVPILPKNLIDHIMQGLSALWPNMLPKKMEDFRKRYEHHLILKMRDSGIEEATDYLQEHLSGDNGDWFACTLREGQIASLHRFAAAGAAIRYEAVHTSKISGLVALDVALRRNEEDWFDDLPQEIEDALVHKLYCGHFMCHVFHNDYLVKKGYDTKAIKKKLLEIFEKRGAQYPAEHNVGHVYEAKPALADFYKKCDPTNTLNPGLGKTSRKRNYA